MIRARNEKDIEYRRTTILEAAATLFVENDYEKISMDLIAKAVQLTRSTLYQYFKSKDEILLTIINENLAKGNHLYQEAVMRCKNPLDQLSAIAEVTYTNNKSNRHLHAIYVKIRPLNILKTADTEQKELYRKSLDYRMQGTLYVLSAGIKAGLIRADKDPDLLVNYFLISMSNLVDYCIQLCATQDNTDLADQHFKDYIELLIDSLRPRTVLFREKNL